MKLFTRFSLYTISFLLVSCEQEEGTNISTPTNQNPVISQTEPEPESIPSPEERYNHGAGAPTDPVAAIEWYTEFSEAGIVDATYRLGMCYYAARSIPMNFVKAVEQLRKAAEAGHKEAAAKLAECYEWGVGVEADPAEAARWRPAGTPAPAPIGEPAVSVDVPA